MNNMKNIHLIPTDKPSRLYKTGNFLLLDSKAMPNNILETINQHIYITNDEEIKEGDWVIYKNNFFKIENGDNELFHLSKKIILTTDQDLINDGVQAIDDTFLEWFVKNPSCEEVEIVYGLFNPMGRQVDPMNLGQNHSQCVWKYKITIPQEKPKQETLEEAADYYSSNPLFRMGTPRQDIKRGFELGVKWQQEQDKNKYSEEEVKELCKKSRDEGYDENTLEGIGANEKIVPFGEWFEQFKKK
jgi:hypothetical protein